MLESARHITLRACRGFACTSTWLHASASFVLVNVLNQTGFNPYLIISLAVLATYMSLCFFFLFLSLSLFLLPSSSLSLLPSSSLPPFLPRGLFRQQGGQRSLGCGPGLPDELDVEVEQVRLRHFRQHAHVRVRIRDRRVSADQAQPRRLQWVRQSVSQSVSLICFFPFLVSPFRSVGVFFSAVAFIVIQSVFW